MKSLFLIPAAMIAFQVQAALAADFPQASVQAQIAISQASAAHPGLFKLLSKNEWPEAWPEKCHWDGWPESCRKAFLLSEDILDPLGCVIWPKGTVFLGYRSPKSLDMEITVPVMVGWASAPPHTVFPVNAVEIGRGFWISSVKTPALMADDLFRSHADAPEANR